MPDRHRDPVVNTRVPADVRDAARVALQQRGWTIETYLAACLAAAGSAPDSAITAVGPHALPPRRRGRPPAS